MQKLEKEVIKKMRRELVRKSRVIALVLSICMVFGMTVHAQNEEDIHSNYKEVDIVRKASGDMEPLLAYEVSDELSKEWLAEGNQIAEYQQQSSEAQAEFLNCGSDYGYLDMDTCSNGEDRQYLYSAMKEACEGFTLNSNDADEITVSDQLLYRVATIDLSEHVLTSEEKQETYFMFRNDNPQFFWLSNAVVWSTNSLVVLTYDAYRLGTDRKAALQEIMETMDKVYKEPVTDSDSTYRKVLKIHDTLIADIEYSDDTSIPIAYSIAGAMTSGKSAVCEGYSKVMQLMMNYYDIENVYVTGTAGGAHAWNMVRMKNGIYYWLDATWDDQPYEQYCHDYFLVGNQNYTDHESDSNSGAGTKYLYSLPVASDVDYSCPLESILVDKNEIYTVPGQSGTIGYTLNPEETTDSVSVTFTSSDSKIVSVDSESGDWIANAIGTAKITLKGANNISASVLIYVEKNQIGDVNIDDLRLILKYVCGKNEFTEQQMILADVDGNGEVNIVDLRQVLRYVCGKIDEL